VGWIPAQWLVIIAIALSMTFVEASPLNSAAQDVYARLRERLKRFETKTRLADDLPIGPGHATIAILGMGRVGTAAYDIMRQRYGETIIAVDGDPEVVQVHQAVGRNVILGDATDYDFWARIDPVKDRRVRLAMLTMPNHTANVLAIGQMRRRGYSGLIAATAKYPDEVQELKEAGAEAAFNIYAEAGVGFAEHVCERLDARLQVSADRHA
jgi:voltage-gated potassium channel Kch